MPGDVVLGRDGAVIFIPPQLAERVVESSEITRLRDEFGHAVCEPAFTPPARSMAAGRSRSRPTSPPGSGRTWTTFQSPGRTSRKSCQGASSGHASFGPLHLAATRFAASRFTLR